MAKEALAIITSIISLPVRQTVYPESFNKRNILTRLCNEIKTMSVNFLALSKIIIDY